MDKILPVEAAAKQVVHALFEAGYKEPEILNIFRSLYHGEAWNEYELAAHIFKFAVERKTRIVPTIQSPRI